MLNSKILTILLISTFIAASSIIPALASPSFDVGQTHQGQKCKIKGSTVVVSVTENVLNANDSGTGGTTWAIDNFTRAIKVVREQDGSFCAILFYHGQFTTVGGSSPAGSTSISNGIKGTFTGVVKTKNFNATLNPSGPTTGLVGTHDYKCNGTSSCPGYVAWQTLFFNNMPGIDSSWFQFLYNGNLHGIWKNSSTGNSSDIQR